MSLHIKVPLILQSRILLYKISSLMSPIMICCEQLPGQMHFGRILLFYQLFDFTLSQQVFIFRCWKATNDIQIILYHFFWTSFKTLLHICRLLKRGLDPMAILNSIGGIAASPPPNPEAHATRLQSSEQLDTTLSDKHYDKGKRAWCVVGGAFAVIWATYGLLASNGVFLEHWTTHELSTYTSEQVGWINGVHLFLTLFLGAPAGALFDKLGSQYLLSAGSVFYLGGLFGLGECTKYWHFMLAYGVTAGIGNAIISTTAMAVLVHWFRKKRGLVNGIVMAGGSLGGVVFPLSMRPLFQKFGWANSIRILAGFISLLVITGNFCIKSRVLQKVEEYGQPKDFVRWRVVFVVIGIAGEFAIIQGDHRFLIRCSIRFRFVRSPWLASDICHLRGLFHDCQLQYSGCLERVSAQLPFFLGLVLTPALILEHLGSDVSCLGYSRIGSVISML